MVTIISEKHYKRLKGLIAEEDIILGGGYDDKRRFIITVPLEEAV